MLRVHAPTSGRTAAPVRGYHTPIGDLRQQLIHQRAGDDDGSGEPTLPLQRTAVTASSAPGRNLRHALDSDDVDQDGEDNGEGGDNGAPSVSADVLRDALFGAHNFEAADGPEEAPPLTGRNCENIMTVLERLSAYCTKIKRRGDPALGPLGRREGCQGGVVLVQVVGNENSSDALMEVHRVLRRRVAEGHLSQIEKNEIASKLDELINELEDLQDNSAQKLVDDFWSKIGENGSCAGAVRLMEDDELASLLEQIKDPRSREAAREHMHSAEVKPDVHTNTAHVVTAMQHVLNHLGLDTSKPIVSSVNGGAEPQPRLDAAIAKLYDASTTLHERPKPSNSNHAEYYCIAKLLGVGGLKWFSKKRTVLMTCSRFACARCQRFLPDLCAALNIEIVVIARTSTEARFPVRIISRGGFAEL